MSYRVTVSTGKYYTQMITNSFKTSPTDCLTLGDRLTLGSRLTQVTADTGSAVFLLGCASLHQG